MISRYNSILFFLNITYKFLKTIHSFLDHFYPDTLYIFRQDESIDHNRKKHSFPFFSIDRLIFRSWRRADIKRPFTRIDREIATSTEEKFLTWRISSWRPIENRDSAIVVNLDTRDLKIARVNRWQFVGKLNDRWCDV